MERIKSVLRLVGIFLIPVVPLVLSAIIWQNNGIFVDKFRLVGNWWALEKVRLSLVLFWFLLLGALLTLGFILLLKSERNLRRELLELRRQLKKEPEQEKPEKPAQKKPAKIEPDKPAAGEVRDKSELNK